MATMKKISSDRNRLALLQQSADRGAADMAAGRPYLSQEKIDALNAFIPQFEAARQQMQISKAQRSNQLHQANEAINSLKKHVRDIWGSVRRQVSRQDLPADVFNYYRLPQDGVNPVLTGRMAWLTMAADIITGDDEATTAGYPPVTNPRTGQLQTALDLAQAELAQNHVVQQNYYAAQDALWSRRIEADGLIRDVLAELRYVLRQETAVRREQIMQLYGVAYESGPDLLPEDGEFPVEGAAEEIVTETAVMLEPEVVGWDDPALAEVNGNGTAVAA